VDSNTLVWTLGIEVMCYLLAPRFRQLSTPVLLILIAISAAAYAVYPRIGFSHYSTLLWGLPLLMFAWAWIAGFVLQRCENAPLVGIAIAALSVVLVTVNTAYHTQYSAACVCGAAIVVTFAGYIPVPCSVGGILNYFGDLSYPIYLFHLPTLLLGYCILSVGNIYGLTAMAIAISAVFLFIESVLKPVVSRHLRRDQIPSSPVIR
jgi:peptidoglycan/LPS O-acetylase OafA/YrhL